MCLPLLIFPCTIKSRSSLLVLAHPGGPRKRAVKRLWCGNNNKNASPSISNSFLIGLRRPYANSCQPGKRKTEEQLCGVHVYDVCVWCTSLLTGSTTSLGWTCRPYGRQPDTQTDLLRTVVIRQTPTVQSTQALQGHRQGQHEEVWSATQVTEHGCT